jgi:cell division protein ZapE
MDIFYAALPTNQKMRWHFHRFMQHVHNELKVLQGQANPLKKVAERLARRALIICLDEFLVNDITDAMLLANLLTALFNENITLITTANVPPEQLYRNGLQRAQFLPAIALLERHLTVLHLTTALDYRLRQQKRADTYFYPLNEQADIFMQNTFKYFAQADYKTNEMISISGRTIETLAVAKNTVWFSFQTICHTPRSQRDYLFIAQRFAVVLVSNVPYIDAEEKDKARYFINLVDVFYDAGVILIISAANPVDAICSEKNELAFEFKRTRSRLIEMQGEEYLNKKG